jgi:hypothetical protein
MDHPFIKAGAALVLGAVLASPAYAVSPLSLADTASLLIPVEDEENEEVWRDLRPDVAPPEAAVGKEGEAPQAAPPERPKEEGEIEEKEMKEGGLPVPE